MIKLNDNEIKKVINTALSGNDFAEIYYEKRYNNTISLKDEKIDKINSGFSEGVGIRIIKGEDITYGYTNNIAFENLVTIAKNLNLNYDENNFIEKEIVFNKKNVKSDVLIEYDDVEVSKKIDLLRDGYNYAKENCDIDIIKFYGTYSDSKNGKLIVNSDGIYSSETINKGLLKYYLILKKGNEIETGYGQTGTSFGYEHFTDSKNVELVKSALYTAKTMFNSKEFEKGKMDVLLSGKAGGTMIHEACGHGLEADLILNGTSIYKDMIGKKVANEKVTVIDNGTIEGLYGTSYFDDEGNKTSKNILIENGILKKYMNSNITSKKTDNMYSGNGRRQGYSHIPIPRMTNTYIENGNDKFDEMLKSIKKGVYVTKMGGGQVDTITGNFVFAAVEAYLIVDGEITHPVKNITLIGNGKTVLNNITAVSNDLDFVIGICGKSGQGVPVTTGQPTLLIKDMIVG